MERGDFIRIEYVGRLESGEIFDLTDEELAKREKIFNSNMKYAPAPIVVGAGLVVPGLEKALLEMKVGEKRDVIVKPDDAFGQRNPSLVRTVQGKLFTHVPVPGQLVDFGNLRGRVQSVSGGRVRVDFNHPLAGKTLKYHVFIKDKIDGSTEQVKTVLDMFGATGDVEIDDKAANVHARLPPQAKEKVSKLVLENVKGVEKVNFVETFSKNDDKSKS